MTTLTKSLTAILFIATLAHAGQVAPALDQGRRAADRQARAGASRNYLTAKASADNAYMSTLGGIVRWLAEQGAQAEAEQVLGDMKKLNDAHSSIDGFETLVAGIATPKTLDGTKQKELTLRLKAAGKACAESYRQIAERCYRGNLPGYAYDLVMEMVRVDPDNALAWGAINRVKGETGWVTRFELEIQNKGLVYLKGLGWVAKGNVARVQAGEWFENGRWMTMAEANQAHASMGAPWVVETDNFVLRSSASRRETMKVAERLEATRQLCYRRYLDFFTRGAAQKSSELLFNPRVEKKLAVFYFGTQAEYADFISRSSTIKDKELMLRSQGFYSPFDHASFFYYDANLGPLQFHLMQHEVTHQILGEFIGPRAPAWLSEGVAEVMGNACPDEHNRLALPQGVGLKNVSGAAALLAEGKLPPLGAIVSLPHEQFHQPENRLQNYMLAGAIATFLLERHDGHFAADFQEYMHDAYKGAKTSVADYIGVDLVTLDREFRAYLQASQTAAQKRDADQLKRIATRQAQVAAAVARKTGTPKSAKAASVVKPANDPINKEEAAAPQEVAAQTETENPFKAAASSKNVFDQFAEEQDGNQ